MKRILLMSVIATSGMTLFSYLFSVTTKEKFLETILLNQLIFPERKEKMKNHPAGFAIHYAVGTFFSALYFRLWNKNVLSSDVLTSTAVGFITGLAGISGWYSILKLHPDPPGIKPRMYFLQLLFAHILFGYLNCLVFRKVHEHDQ